MVYKQNPFEHANLHNGRWIYRVSATFPSNQAIGTYRLLSCGNNGYDQGYRENHDGPTKNRTVTSAIDAETIVWMQSAGSSRSLMTAAAFCAWVMKVVLKQAFPPLQRDDA